ncbi:MAG: hydrogenase [Marinilabiliales bacterium]|nr:MAG: hydrogenase [Marinilabiliales bacterium]
MKDKNDDKKKTRRDFLKLGLASGAGIIAGGVVLGNISKDGKTPSGETLKLLAPDGSLVEVDKAMIEEPKPPHINREEAKKGIPGRNFVMVVDLSKCKNARKCTEKCQKGHHLPPDQEWMKVFLLKDNDVGPRYWFPRPCYHCDNPPCVKVCPVGATYKRQDGIVLIDTKRCIGCKFCMSACPYSARTFNWNENEGNHVNQEYSPETSVPSELGTVGKCDFCPDRSRIGKVPYCVDGCPMGAIYFGDANEDAVTNGDATVRLTTLLEENGGYRYLEHLGTKPRVYYLPPVGVEYERGLEDLDENIKLRYKDMIDDNDLTENHG